MAVGNVGRDVLPHISDGKERKKETKKEQNSVLRQQKSKDCMSMYFQHSSPDLFAMWGLSKSLESGQEDKQERTTKEEKTPTI
jgi:hypothetical protein